MNAVYIGSGYDFFPLRVFKSLIKRFIYVDVEGTPHFASGIQTLLHKMQFRKCDQESGFDLDVYVGPGGTELYYFKNQAFPNISKDCRHAISTCSALICCGFIPSSEIINMMQSTDVFIGNGQTHYEGELVDILYREAIFSKYMRFQFPKLSNYNAGDVFPEFVVTEHSDLQDLIETTRKKLTL
jgi:hypothetical protein